MAQTTTSSLTKPTKINPEMKPSDSLFTQFGSIIATLMFIYAIVQQYFPHQLRSYLEKYTHRSIAFFYPYIQITFNEVTGDHRFNRSEAFSAIETYLSSTSSSQAKRLKADLSLKSNHLLLSMDDHEEISLDFEGVKLWWASGKQVSKTQSFGFYNPSASEERRFYKLTFHKKHRELILRTYLNHVLKEGNAMKVMNRQRKLYTNNGSHWSHVAFDHPATFATLAMDKEKKDEIVNDLITFSQSEQLYARIGRAWKRGYLLYGPPGTGKSTMVAAMANLLNYDIYDLELTAVKDNTELRKLLIETTSKSIIVIEDIDCSLDLTGQRKKKNEKVENDAVEKRDQERSGNSQVTLSGLLNFIDGLWSACRGERLIVFTTNFVEKLDPALTRKGRMDKHVELSYCNFKSFRVLARNYLSVETHESFERIERLLSEVNVTPADVAEYLMPTCRGGEESCVVGRCLERLVQGLEESKKEKN